LCFILFDVIVPHFEKSFAEAGVNKSIYWTNKDVLSSETYRIFL